MSQGKLKKLAIASVTAIALSAAFNSAAQAENAPAPEPVATTTTLSDGVNDNQNAVAPAAEKQFDARQSALMLTQLRDLDRYSAIDRRQSNPGYDFLTDPMAHQMLDTVVRSLENGADPNYIDEETKVSAFAWSMWLAYTLDRPDVVEAFLDHGADARQQMAATMPVPRSQQEARRMLRFPFPRGVNHITMMDHALTAMVESNLTYKRHITSAVRIINMLKAHGATYADSTAVGHLVSDATDLARTIVSLKVMKNEGMITQEQYDEITGGSPELAEAARSISHIDDEFLKNMQASLTDYPDGPPGGPEPYEVQEGDTLVGLAHRFQFVMGAKDTLDAMNKIAALNDIDLAALGQSMDTTPVLRKGVTILIPQPPEVQLGHITPRAGFSILDLAGGIAPLFYKPGLPAEDIAREIAHLNGIDEADIDVKMDGRTQLWMPFINDGFSHINPLVPPQDRDPNRTVHLFVAEGAGPHQKQTFRSAVNTAYAVNRSVDFSRFHALNQGIWGAFFLNPETGPKILRVLHHPENALKDNIVYSSSSSRVAAQPDTSEETLDQMRQSRRADQVQSEINRIQMDRVESARPIIFHAAGNDHPVRGAYAHRFSDIHSSRSTFVGAVGTYPALGFPGNRTDKIISPYSGYGANVCGLLPPNMGGQFEGTSFSTPATAALYRQFSEWYGDKLSFEEIMAVAFMTADRDLLDYKDIMAINDIFDGKAQFDINKFEVEPAKFQVNAAGLPINERCGAGMVNPVRMNEMLQLMVTMKNDLGQDSAYHTGHVFFGDAAAINMVTDADGAAVPEYVYHVTMPQDMTLDKLTFFVGQERGAHSDVTVVSPGGFSYVLPKSPTDTVTTLAFSYEDVKEGDVLEIRSRHPMGENAGVMLRGHEGANVIQVMRDHLRARGVLATPLVDMAPSRDMPVMPQMPAPANDDTPAPADQVPSIRPQPAPAAPQEQGQLVQAQQTQVPANGSTLIPLPRRPQVL